jgi:hypothetical protein
MTFCVLSTSIKELGTSKKIVKISINQHYLGQSCHDPLLALSRNGFFSAP